MLNNYHSTNLNKSQAGKRLSPKEKENRKYLAELYLLRKQATNKPLVYAALTNKILEKGGV